jgi:hypothetical protein
VWRTGPSRATTCSETVLREDPTLLEPRLTVRIHDVEARIAEILTPRWPAPHVGPRGPTWARLCSRLHLHQGRWRLDERTDVARVVRDELLAFTVRPGRRLSPATARPMRRVARRTRFAAGSSTPR